MEAVSSSETFINFYQTTLFHIQENSTLCHFCENLVCNISKLNSRIFKDNYKFRQKGKAVPLTGRGGPYDCETSRLPHFLDNRLTDGGEVISLMPSSALYAQNIPGIQKDSINKIQHGV
jgi:hypothetical protein